MTDRVYAFLGMAMKAGKLVSGEVNCEKTIRSGKACFVVISQDASDNTKKKFENACKYRNVPYVLYGEKEVLGRLLGKGIRSVVALTDNGFARKVPELVMVQQSNEKIHGGGLIE